MSAAALYLELEFAAADFNRLARAWQQVIDRHSILQSSFAQATQDQLDNKKYDIKLYDLNLQSADKILQVETKIRQSFLDFPINESHWPWFSIKATQYASGAIRFYMGFAPTMLDAHQIYYLLSEWLALYQHPDLELKSLSLTRTTKPTTVNEKPFVVNYAHLYGKLDHQTLTKVRHNSEQHHVSLSVVLLNLFAGELQKQNLNYPVHLSLINRFPFYPFMYDSALFATSVAGLQVTELATNNFVASCQQLDKELHQASVAVSDKKLDQFLYFAPEQKQFALFSCTLEQNFHTGPLYAKRPDILYCNFDLPTPMIDFNLWEQGGQLMFRWSYSKALPAITTNLDASMLQHALSVQRAEQNSARVITADSDKTKKALALGGAALVLGGTAATAKANDSKDKKPPGAAPLLLETNTKDDAPMQDAFNGVGSSLVTLSNEPNAWQKNDDQKLIEDTKGSGTTDGSESSLDTSSNGSLLDKVGAFSALGLLAAAVAGLAASSKDNNSGTSNPTTPSANTAATGKDAGSQNPQPSTPNRGGPGSTTPTNNANDNKQPAAPQAPSATDVAKMTEPEIVDAYAEFEKKVKKKHEIPRVEQTQQDELCAQFTSMTGELGPDALKVKDQLTDMGKNVDAMSAAVNSGDPKQMAAASGQLSESQSELLNGMNQQGLLDAGNQNPLAAQSLAIYSASQNLDSVEKVQDLNQKVDSIDSTFSEYESKLSADTLKTQTSETLKAEFSNSPLASPIAAAQGKCNELQALNDQFSQYNCQSLMDEQSSKVIDEMTQKAQELQTMIPPPQPNPIDEKITNTQAALNNFESTLAAKQAELTASGDNPAYGLQDPAVQTALENLNKQASDYAGAVNSQCPICSASDPSVPKRPNCGHNHADVLSQTNPFQVPQMNLQGALHNLLAIPQPSMPVLSALDKLKGIVSRMTSFSSNSGSFTNPIAALQETVKTQLQQLVTQHTALLNCSGYKDSANSLKDGAISTGMGATSGKQQEVEIAIASLKNAEARLQELRQGSSSSESSISKSEMLKKSMQEAMTKGKDQIKSAGMQQADAGKAAALAGATAAVSQATVCLSAMSVPAIQTSKGAANPDTVIVSGFTLCCNFGTPPQAKVVLPPTGGTIDNKQILTANGVPVIANFGMCKFPGPTPSPCVGTVLVTGGSTTSKITEMSVATLQTAKFICGKGQMQTLLDAGQTSPKPVTTT